MTDNFNSYNSSAASDVYAQPIGLWSNEKILISYFFKNTAGKILILGCGGGRTVIPLIQIGYQITALDFSPKMINLTEEKLKQFNLTAKTVVGRAEDLSQFSEAEFDYVFFPFNGLDSISPLSQRLKCLTEIKRVLKPSGYLLYSTHNLFSCRHFINYLKSNKKPFVSEISPYGQLTLYYANPPFEIIRLKKIFSWTDIYSTRYLVRWFNKSANGWLFKWPTIFLSRFVYLIAQK
ncbi:MAG: hypothetical protein A3J65_04420 [Candidatus Buchananbacteria bacterium RIFCSPHIGHO2_02_FULL_45_11b]|uniref:Methyltransferase domain-containing protein n=1 Tax=Candidatus Buchananbacteria bacterium RIFCSPHIGHO2_02_FULL_45_11b TaxID=1797541 RepID=A0A1G1YFI6_9BACT|nr:MAG: hypothetical protein A3J65_04420 [Candidatus Buchananbacteria bacterium RIFCSPHIGHO2_02_FULL_45_11b]